MASYENAANNTKSSSSNNNNNFYANKHCAFCKRNKEPESIYKSHQLKDSDGLVSCPQLAKYRCELCGATGQQAHTRSYCPLAANFRRQLQQESAAVPDLQPSSSSASNQHIIKFEPQMFRNMAKVSNTRYNSAGKLRRQNRNFNQQHQQQYHWQNHANNNSNNNNNTSNGKWNNNAHQQTNPRL